MKKITMALMTVAIVAAVATPAAAQRHRPRPTYNECYQLGLARGFIVSVGDWRNFEKFIYECMAGRVPF
jgi:hypothetical protein